MSATGLEVFDKTLQTTNLWLKEVAEAIGPDRKRAWHVLGAVLRALRDRLTLEEAAHLGAELPLLVRGLYYDQWRPAAQPVLARKREEFLALVASGLADIGPTDPAAATQAVFGVLERHVAAGEIAKVRNSLPAEIRSLWP
jgi:uncharacterized protein (DUF2267 family)